MAHLNPFSDEILSGGLVHAVMSRHEAEMFTCLLRQGALSAREAIAQSGLDRATGYRILGRLRARSLIRASDTRPQKFASLEVSRLGDRLIAIFRDELELHRMWREHLSRGFRSSSVASAAPSDEPAARGVRSRLLPGNESIVPCLMEIIGGARETVDILARPQAMRAGHRRELIDALVQALRRGVRIRLVTDCHPPDVTFVVNIIRRNQGSAQNLYVRFFAPQLARMYLADQKTALRTLNLPGAPPRLPELGILSEEPEFVKAQAARFQTCWRDGMPIERALITANRAVLSPPGVSRELRDWLRGGHLPGHDESERGVPPLSRP